MGIVTCLMNNCLILVVLMFSAAIIPLPGLAADSTNVVENLPAAKWDFEGSDGLVMKKSAYCRFPSGMARPSSAGKSACLCSPSAIPA